MGAQMVVPMAVTAKEVATESTRSIRGNHPSCTTRTYRSLHSVAGTVQVAMAVAVVRVERVGRVAVGEHVEQVVVGLQR